MMYAATGLSVSSSPDSTPEPSLRRIGRYTVLEDLARGGMAQVYVAQKDGAPEICVLKQLLVELESHATAGKRFYREAHVACYLDHPNIARTIDAGPEDHTFCIAMEFISGKDIESMMHLLMRQGRMLPYELSISVANSVLLGLEYAHTARDPNGAPLDLVHRDLSPRNVMLSFDGEVKIIDFGLARGKVDDFKTAPGMVLGTLRYVSPEQAVAEPVDCRSDLYSISVVLFEMLSGRPLVRDGKPIEVLTQVVNEVPPPLSSLNPNLPPALDAVMSRALDKTPEKRFANAGELRRALLAAAGDLARVPKEAVGAFVRQLFPKDVARCARMIALGQRRYSDALHRRIPSLYPSTERTRAAVMPSAISAPDDPGSRTRTGYVMPGELGPNEHAPTRATEMSTRLRDEDASSMPTMFDPEHPEALATQAMYGDNTQLTPSRTSAEVLANTLIKPGLTPTNAFLVRPVSKTRSNLALVALLLSATIAVVVAIPMIMDRQDIEPQAEALDPPVEPTPLPGAAALASSPEPAKPAKPGVPAAKVSEAVKPPPPPVETKTARPSPARKEKSKAPEGASPAPPATTHVEDPLAPISALIRQLEGQEGINPTTLDRISNAIKAKASGLPQTTVDKIKAKLLEADFSSDPDATRQYLKEALAMLKSELAKGDSK